MAFYRVFLQTLNPFIGKFQVCVPVIPGLLIYVPLLQTKSNNNENLDKKVDDCRRKLLKCPSWRLFSRCQLLHYLSDAFYDRFKQLGRMEDLEEAIRCQRQALALRPPDRSMSLNILAFFLRTRFKHLGRMEDLEEAITCDRQALALRPHGHPDRSMSLNNLAISVSTRFQRLGRMEDLEEAITCHRQALALLPHGHPNCSSSLNNLASA